METLAFLLLVAMQQQSRGGDRIHGNNQLVVAYQQVLPSNDGIRPNTSQYYNFEHLFKGYCTIVSSFFYNTEIRCFDQA
jgi:hypothetical protein